MSNIKLKDVASAGAGAVIGVGVYKLTRYFTGKISDARMKKNFEAAEPVDIDTDEFDVEVVDD